VSWFRGAVSKFGVSIPFFPPFLLFHFSRPFFPICSSSLCWSLHPSFPLCSSADLPSYLIWLSLPFLFLQGSTHSSHLGNLGEYCELLRQTVLVHSEVKICLWVFQEINRRRTSFTSHRPKFWGVGYPNLNFWGWQDDHNIHSGYVTELIGCIESNLIEFDSEWIESISLANCPSLEGIPASCN